MQLPDAKFIFDRETINPVTRNLDSCNLWIKSYSVTIQMKAAEQYFAVVLFIMLYKVVLTFESVEV